MSGFPFEEPTDARDGSVVKYDGPTLVVRGTKSRYVGDETIPIIKQFFPNSSIADVEAGHWVISENPEAFRKGMYSLPSRLGSCFIVSRVLFSDQSQTTHPLTSNSGGDILEGK
jgi:hypothetical protein